MQKIEEASSLKNREKMKIKFNKNNNKTATHHQLIESMNSVVQYQKQNIQHL